MRALLILAAVALPSAAHGTDLRDLVRAPRAELEARFAAGTPTAPPVGFAHGRPVKNPGTRRAPLNAALTRPVWQGKIFREDGTMINRVFGAGRAIPADVYVTESRTDGAPAVVFDYSRSKLWPNVRDEVREIEPGLFLGIMYKNGQEKMFFALDARR
jgi:hypothetical protein